MKNFFLFSVILVTMSNAMEKSSLVPIQQEYVLDDEKAFLALHEELVTDPQKAFEFITMCGCSEPLYTVKIFLEGILNNNMIAFNDLLPYEDSLQRLRLLQHAFAAIMSISKADIQQKGIFNLTQYIKINKLDFKNILNNGHIGLAIQSNNVELLELLLDLPGEYDLSKILETKDQYHSSEYDKCFTVIENKKMLDSWLE